jgi:hypothetical protein
MNVHLDLTTEELDFIAKILQQVPYGTVVQAGMTNLLPVLVQQANRSIVAQASQPPDESPPAM